MWHLPGSGITPTSPALAGGVFTSVLPREPQAPFLKREKSTYINVKDLQVFGTYFLSPRLYKARILKPFLRFFAGTWSYFSLSL